MTDRTTLSDAHAVEKSMERLRAKPACKDDRSAMFDPVGRADHHDGTISHLDSGNGDRYACKIASRASVAEFRPGMTGRN